jgi:hypothetical protein
MTVYILIVPRSNWAAAFLSGIFTFFGVRPYGFGDEGLYF